MDFSFYITWIKGSKFWSPHAKLWLQKNKLPKSIEIEEREHIYDFTQGGKDVVGLIWTVSHREGESYINALLLHVTGAILFEDIRKVEGKVCATYRENC